MRRNRRFSLLLLVAWGTTVFGCGSSQVEDFITLNQGRNPTALVISPKTVTKQLGETQQFMATANFDNGTTEDVTNLVQWSSSNPTRVTIGAGSGLATALLPGLVTITAQSSGFSDTAALTVTGGITRVSVDSAGLQVNGASRSYINRSISADGRLVAFDSDASNLVAGDGNAFRDVFVHDRQTGVTTRVSLNSAGVEGNGESREASISSDGRFVGFLSFATNLVTGDNNATFDVFVHDRQTGATTRVSVNSAGVEGDGGSQACSISADGRLVAFYSTATNLVPGDTNSRADVFVHDRQTFVTTRVSVDSADVEGNGNSSFASISGDGRFVGFESQATNLVVGDNNGQSDVFVRDRQTGATTRVSLDSAGAQGTGGSSYQPSLSSDGRFVAFYSYATNLVAGDTNAVADSFVHDRQTAATTRLSLNSAGVEGNGDSYHPSISGDGRFVAFFSTATNLVTGDTNSRGDIFVHDRQTAATTRVSLNSAGVEGNGESFYPTMSLDGLFVAFTSEATNLVSGDTNAKGDVFVTNR